MPLNVLTASGFAKRERSIPNAVSSRGAITSPAPGTLRKSSASGCWSKVDRRTVGSIALTAPISWLASPVMFPKVTLEDPDGSQHYLSALLVTSIERIGPLATDA